LNVKTFFKKFLNFCQDDTPRLLLEIFKRAGSEQPPLSRGDYTPAALQTPPQFGEFVV
jgi:hypothetical protein